MVYDYLCSMIGNLEIFWKPEERLPCFMRRETATLKALRVFGARAFIVTSP